MQEDGSAPDQEAMSFSSDVMPICTTPTNINAIILNSQIPGAQRLASPAGTNSDTNTSSTFTQHGSQTGSQARRRVNVANRQRHASAPVTHRQRHASAPLTRHVRDSSKGQTALEMARHAKTRLNVGRQVGVGQTGLSVMTQHGQFGIAVASQNQGTVTMMTTQDQSAISVTPHDHAAVSATQNQTNIRPQSQGSVAITQAQLPIITSVAAGSSLRLPSIVAVEGAQIKPDISLCSRVLNSFSDQDQASSDLEVQSVMFPETRGLLPTVKRICPSRSSSSSKSSKSSYSPMRQPTTLTNAKRGNVQTATPTFLPEDKTIHQLAAQGELSILSERIENLEVESVDKTDVQGYTPLMWACAHDQIDVVEFLLQFGANASKVSVEGECALSFACSNGNMDVVRLLLAENVDVNNYDWNGGTPLLYTVYNNHPKCCELLLQVGADMTVETDSGHTALSLALALSHHGVQQVIEKHMLGLLQTL